MTLGLSIEASVAIPCSSFFAVIKVLYAPKPVAEGWIRDVLMLHAMLRLTRCHQKPCSLKAPKYYKVSGLGPLHYLVLGL